MRTFSLIVLDKSGHEVAGYTAVMRFIIRLTHEDVNVVELFHQTSRGRKESSTKKAGLP
jgi:hypothetical protein